MSENATPTIDITQEPFSVRAERLLTRVYRGLHHCPEIHKYGYGRWEVNHDGDLSTWDFDLLTRLVIAAHDECIRAEITSSGPRMVKIRLHPRFSRDGGMTERHPTIETAIEMFRGGRMNHICKNCKHWKRGRLAKPRRAKCAIHYTPTDPSTTAPSDSCVRFEERP